MIREQALAGQRQQMAGQAPLAGQTPVQSMARDALNSFAQLNASYQAPLRSTPQFQAAGSGQPDPQQTQVIAQLMSAQMGNHPINQSGPNPASPLFNQASDGQASQIAQMPAWERVAKGIWDNTLGGYIHTWQTNPEAAAAETAVGIGLMAATAVMPELAPVIWTGAALLAAPTVLPNTVRSVADAWHNPNDATITSALINVGTAAISIGSPVKAFRGLGTARSIAETQASLLNTVSRPGELAGSVLGINEKAAQPGSLTDVRSLVDPLAGVDQYHVVPQTVTELEAEIAARSGGQAPIDVTDENVEGLRQLLDVHGQLMRRVQDATDDTLGEAKRVKDAFEQQDLVPALRDFSARYGYVLAKESRMPRMTAQMVAQVPSGVKSAIDRRMRGIMGIVYGAGEGHGWDGVSDGVVHSQLAENLSEAMARGSAAGGLEHAGLQIEQLFREVSSRAGVDDSALERIYRAIEGDPGHADPEHHWNELSPTHQYLAEWLNTAFGTMTNYAYKHGHVELPIQRYVPRIQERLAGTGVERPHRTSDEFLRRPGEVQSRGWIADDWGRANEMDAQEFHADSEQGLRPLSDRLRQQILTRGGFSDREAARSAAFQASQPHRELLRDPALNDRLKTARREYGQLTKSLLPDTQRKLDESASALEGLGKQVDAHNARLAELDSRLKAIRGKHGAEPARAQARTAITEATDQLRRATRQLDALRKQREGWQTKLDEYQRRVEGFADRVVAETGHESFRDLIPMASEDLQKVASMPVGGRKLLSGAKLFEVQAGRFLRQMNQTRYREAWGSLAQTRNTQGVKLGYGADRGLSVAEINHMDTDQRPIAVTDDLPPGDPGRQMLNDYELVMPARGQEGQLNYQPAIHVRADIAGKYKAWAQRARSSSELHTAFARSVYGVSVGVPKRLIMGSPAWHGKNVAGRFLALLADHPSVAGHALFQTLKDRFNDPEKYYQLKMQHWMDGGVPANRFNVHHQVNFLEQQATGQRGFGWAMRTAGLGPLEHGHAKLAEGWFWKTIDDVGTAAYLTQKHTLLRTKPWMTEGVAGMLSAEYANNVVGMVNPLYMSKLWKTGRQMAFFAPNWWTSFTRMAAQAVPGSARISHWLSKHPSLAALDPVKMHSLDIRQRKELVRAHRSYFLTYMAAGMAMHDLMNVIFSGHHVWDNQKGRTWDLQFDLSQPAQGDPTTQDVKHAYMSGDPFFSQMADTMNVIGLGHDWGFFHQMTGDGFKQADARQKMGLLMGAMGTGLRRQAASKAGMPVQEALGALGIDAYSLIRDGQVKNIPQTEALAGLLPAGTQAQIAMDDQRKLETRLRITGDPKSLQQLQQLKSRGELPGGVPVAPMLGALRDQFLGLPSLYYTGDEPAQGTTFLSEQQMTRYLQSRQDIETRKSVLSQQLFNGQLSPYDWVNQNEIQTSRYTQLLSDTFGPSSSQGSLWQAYDALNKKYNLDDVNLTQQQKYALLDQRDADWQKQLDAMNPKARSAWWDAHTSMWTDADYLHWMSQQVKSAIASSIDGQSGAHIRQMQNELSTHGLPLTTTALDNLRARDPYLWTYYAALKQMGKSSLLGSLTSAFGNPFASFTVIPDQMAAQVAQLESAGTLSSGTFAKESSLTALGQVARAEGKSSADVAGRYPETPEGQAFGRSTTAQEAAAILQAGTTGLSPQIVSLLQRLASGQAA